MTIKHRNVALCVFFSVITLGIYLAVWYAKMTNETNHLAKTQTASGGKAVFFFIITLGLYNAYWGYKMGMKMHEITGGRDNSVLYLVLSLMSLGILTNCLIQSELNTVANA